VGRATRQLGETDFHIDAIGDRTAREVFRTAVRHLDCQRDLEVHTEVRPTSADLMNLFDRPGTVPLANDTSIGAGYAPLSETERLVLETERFLTAADTLAAHPYLGEDVKVLAVRAHDHVHLTVAAAFVARHVRSVDHYFECKRRIHEQVLQRARKSTRLEIDCRINPADDPDAGSVYLTVTGTSAEAGDDGQVGRGNRANGLITPGRPMSLEALAGKNPVTHVGKIYNVWASRLSEELAGLAGIDEVQCQLASRIGSPITEPQVVHVAVRGPGVPEAAALSERVRRALDRLPEIWKSVVRNQ
jgi:S-adenosylmethionine synthetase